jgi:DNA-binding XRE family transcriptional regulator
LIRINAGHLTFGKHAPGLKGAWWRVMRSRTSSRPGRRARAQKSDPYAASEFLRSLGDRVREMRHLCGMSRKELARQSGISERYVAQIEAGKGNVSIVLLLRIAYAIRAARDDAA